MSNIKDTFAENLQLQVSVLYQSLCIFKTGLSSLSEGWAKYTEKHSYKRRKDSLEGSLVRVLFAAELEFPKILVPRLPQNTSNVNIESTIKLKQLYYLCDQRFGALIHIHFIVVILICF